jgi:omega-6 fatty acid desaturase (delta-12 desaturase)
MTKSTTPSARPAERPGTTARSTPAWRTAVARFEQPSIYRSTRQLLNSLVPYFALLVTMYYMMDVSYWITVALAIPAAGFLVRIFIICHDCGHGSFFRSRRANRIVGFITGLLTFVPSYYWSHEHARHHATSGNLDSRGTGDIWTVTIREYLAMPRWQRVWYRLYRNPFFLFGLAPSFVFFIRYRFWRSRDNARGRRSTIYTNLAIVAVILIAHFTIGFKAYMMVQLPILLIAFSAGVWLFYVQHQFEDTYWEPGDRWNYVRQAIDGSSFYDMPRIMHWFTGNIGFHHIHHLSPRIPNYFLRDCHRSHPMFRQATRVTLRTSLKSMRYRLWDEDEKKLVGFNHIPQFLKRQAAGSQA